jgi:cation:H+ antiporter
MNFFIEFLILIISLSVLIIAASKMVDSSIFISKKMAIPKSIIGATILAYGTSSPEIIVSLQANFDGQPGIAIGNVIGSNIANVCIGMAIVFYYGVSRLSIRPTYTISVIFLIISTVIVSLAMLDSYISYFEGWAMLITVVILNILLIREANTHQEKETLSSMQMRLFGFDVSSSVIVICILAMSVLLLIISSNFVVSSAVSLAIMMNIEATFIGLSIIAVGTSLPEILVSIASVKKKEFSIAIGNIIGSNTLNMLGVLCLPAIISTIDITSKNLNQQIFLLVLSSVFVLLPFFLNRLHKVLMVIYLAFYVFILFYFGLNS